MQLKVFRIPVVNQEPHEEAVNVFLRSRRVISYSREFVCEGNNSFWAILIEYAVDNVGAKKEQGKIDYRQILNPEDFAMYDRLRKVRKQIAEEIEKPLYAIANNDQLAAIAQRRPKTIAELTAIPGVGKGKAEAFGEALLREVTKGVGNEADGEPVRSDS